MNRRFFHISIFGLILNLASYSVLAENQNLSALMKSSYKSGFYPGVVRYAEEILRTEKDSLAAFRASVYEGESLFKMGRPEEALEILRKYQMNGDPLNPETIQLNSARFYWIGRSCFAQKDFSNAQRCFFSSASIFKELEKASPKTADASLDYYSLSMLHGATSFVEVKDYKNAVPLYEYVISNGSKYNLEDYKNSSIALAQSYNYLGDEKSSSSAMSSSSDGGSGIEDEFITGMSPFETLTAVSVLELDGETLEETGRVYRGWSTGGLGGYEVHGVTLASQYAAVEISGNYRLAVSGSVTDIPVTLKALVDFSETSSVNVNLLTHLEYARVRSLVASGKSVADARQQAESEILDALGIEGSVGNFGDLDIAYSDDGSAILLAVDVIMQGDVSDVQLLLRLKNFAGDIERNGRWNDSTAKAEMAD